MIYACTCCNALLSTKATCLFQAKNKLLGYMLHRKRRFQGCSFYSESSPCVSLHKYDSALSDLSVMSAAWTKVGLSSKWAYSGGASYAVFSAIDDHDKVSFVPSPVMIEKAKKNQVH